jgi:hypothetical protein
MKSERPKQFRVRIERSRLELINHLESLSLSELKNTGYHHKSQQEISDDLIEYAKNALHSNNIWTLAKDIYVKIQQK